VDEKRMNIGFVLPANKKKMNTRFFYQLEMDEMKRRGHQITELPVNLFTYPNLYKKKFIRDIDFVIAHYPQMGIYANYLNKPFGTIYHGPTDALKPVFEDLDTMNNCKWIACECFYNESMLRNWGIKKDLKYWVPVVDTELFKKKKDKVGDKVICGSRLIRMKGIHHAIGAYDGIWCYGDSNDTSYVNYLMGLSGNTHFTGKLSHIELRDLLEDGWLYLFPSTECTKENQQSKTDGIPTVIQEALAMGLQVIASPIGGIPEIKHIHLCEPEVDKLKEAIANIPRELNKNGMDYIHNEFNPKVCVDRMLKDIEDYL
jgi:glycosyltransferase involved in cell wall biosynthesis